MGDTGHGVAGHRTGSVGEVLTGWQIGGGYAYAKAEDADDIA